MILLAIAAAAVAQWTGPRTEEYVGPGYFCGGGYLIKLMNGDRALVLPQSASGGVQGVRLVLDGREVNLWGSAPRQQGTVVQRLGSTTISQRSYGPSLEYTVADDTDFAIRVTSQAFRGYRRDSWFFTRANFRANADDHVPCLAASSY